MRKEEQLHERIIRGISSYKHKYVLIEDIDIRNRIRATVDVIFHHAVFVSALTHSSGNHKRSLAAMMVRLLTRLDSAFTSYCREITYTLADHIKAFLEFTGYRLLSQHPTAPLHERDFLVFPATTTAASLDDDDRRRRRQQQRICISSTSRSSSSSSALLLTLHNIAACFDLMGAAFVWKILGETHVEFAVQRTCELLTDDRHVLGLVKKSLLVDLLDNWLTVKRGLVAGELCRFVRAEIEACGSQQQQQQQQGGDGRTPFLLNHQRQPTDYPPFYQHRHHHQLHQPEQDHEAHVPRPSSIHTRYQLS
ncbi:hypothetical protein BCR42DRAFT_405544 [Absidia repens]|uniref:Uncharacterized protein n=1 Tax=Absidia repens TaxID=90262 RepID=A0A1X2ITK8_9FUNG|nr:hypothetical protein BCR42DRAFT_405544 [Absidia repens]